MDKMNFARLGLAPVLAAGLALLQLASAGSAVAAANCIKGEHKPPFKIGWANIYSIPTWMKETTGTIEDMANALKKQGLVDSLTITDAQGNANTQIQQIQSMIDAQARRDHRRRRFGHRARSRHRRRLLEGNRCHQFRQPCRHQGPDHENRHRSATMGQACSGMARQAAQRQGQHSRLEWTGRRLGQRRSAQGRRACVQGQSGHQNSGGNQHALQRRARAGSRHQPALQQSCRSTGSGARAERSRRER